MFKVFNNKDFCENPRIGTYFRVGANVGICVANLFGKTIMLTDKKICSKIQYMKDDRAFKKEFGMSRKKFWEQDLPEEELHRLIEEHI